MSITNPVYQGLFNDFKLPAVISWLIAGVMTINESSEIGLFSVKSIIFIAIGLFIVSPLAGKLCIRILSSYVQVNFTEAVLFRADTLEKIKRAEYTIKCCEAVIVFIIAVYIFKKLVE